MHNAVLMYHDIRNLNENFFPDRYKMRTFISVDNFEKHIHYIKSKFNILDPNNLRYSKTKLNVLFTFDDGLMDHYNILNILDSNDIKAIFFVPFDSTLKFRPLIVHMIQFLICSKYLTEISKEIQIYHPEFDYGTFSISHYKDNWWSQDMIFVTNFLRYYHKTFIERENICIYLWNKYIGIDLKEFVSNFYLSDSNITDMLNRGHIIGSHGGISIDFNSLDKSDIKNEFNTMGELFTRYKIVNKNIAYPNGGFNNSVIETCISNNYNMGFTTIRGINHISLENNLLIKRIDAPQYITDLKIYE